MNEGLGVSDVLSRPTIYSLTHAEDFSNHAMLVSPVSTIIEGGSHVLLFWSNVLLMKAKVL